MGYYDSRILPWFIDKACGSKGFSKNRKRLFDDYPVSGTVLEIGFGSGTNIPFYPESVKKILAVDPAKYGQKLAAPKIEKRQIEVEYIGLNGAQLPLADRSMDFVVSTMTLCTIPDVETSLNEVNRVLKPGGTFIFMEHGLSPDEKVARRQHRFNGMQKRIFGGCNLNRPIFELVAKSGLQIESSDNRYMPGPKALGYMYTGKATKTEEK